MTAPRILIVDDEPQIRRFLRASLQAHDYTVIEADSGKEGMRQATLQKPELVILDLGLPDTDGLDVIVSLREWSKVPIIVLSVRSDESDKIEALDRGANDYVTKPFSMGELLARMRACLRQKTADSAEAGTVIAAGPITIDLQKRLVTVDGKPVRLSRKEYDLLRILASHSGKVITHQQLLQEVWGQGYVEETQYLRVYIGQLRQKLEADPGGAALPLDRTGRGVSTTVVVKRIVIAIGVVAALAGTFYAANRVYWDRYIDVVVKGGTGDEGTYAPLEKVDGAHAGFIAVAPEAERTIPEATLAEAREYAGKNRSSSLLIWHKGKLQSASYWGGEPGTPVNSRSLHKMLGGLLIGAAIKDGHIKSLNDLVADYIPEWRDTPKATATIRNVLQMSSGLMWFRGGGPYSVASRRYLDAHWDDILLHDVPQEFVPGSAYDYSDITADIMPHLIEGATGKRYAEYLSEAILKPIGALGGEIWVNREGGMPHGGCCLLLPPETWLRIGLLALNGGKAGERQILPEWWTAEMRKPSPHNPHFGLMVWLGQPYAQRRLYARPNSPNNNAPRPGAYHSEPYLADDLFLFDGLNGQIVYIVPSQNLVIVRTGLRPPPGQPEWDNAKLPNMILRGLGVDKPMPAKRIVEAAPPSQVDRIAGETRFWSRWLGMAQQTPITPPGWLDTRETVKGGNGPEIPTASANTIPAAAIQAAADYAANMTSLSLIVARSGQIEHEQYWNGAGPDTVSETYSMAKSVLGLAVGAAVADGSISSVDDAAANVIAEWRNRPKETLTIRQLLTMSSGVKHYRFNFAFDQPPWAEGLRTFLGPDIASRVLDYEIDRVPGAEFNYNSANTQILLTVLERATGKRYADYVSEKLWQPLGAKDATLWLDRPGGAAKAFSYFQARPRDWLRLGLLIEGKGRFDGRQILPESWIAAMTTPSARNPNYGFQMWLGNPPMTSAGSQRMYNRNTAFGAKHSAPYLANDVVFFDGGGGHRVYIVPSKKLVIVRTGARNRPDWDDAAVPNAILAGLAP